ncbi:MAG: FAD-dependent oxidoreductase [Verrucomicrobiota bacterium JB024]|nr:FAD-dependent oxidoreductase [Verrucomicrobiota bacterium JB024]
MNIERLERIPVLGQYDVVVCGGGPSGIPAALAAARSGARVLLLEGTGQLGGVGTSAGVTSLLGGRTRNDGHPCVGGIFREMSEILIARGAGIDPASIPNQYYQPFGWAPGDLAVGFYFEPREMVSLLDEMMVKAGVDVLFFTSFVDAVVEGERVRQVIFFNKAGLQAVEAGVVVDATGDADVAARSGCEFAKGREEDGLMTPATLMFRVDRVDQDALESYMRAHESIRLKDIIQRLRESGEWPFSFDIFISQQAPERGTFMINTTRICGVDGTDGRSISRGMMEGRSQVHELFSIMRKHFPGFADSRIIEVSPSLGIRETRRIRGDFLYTVEDVMKRIEFSDTIGFSGYGFDLPDPRKPSYQPLDEQGVRAPEVIAIPYRIMLPRPVRNILCPGRAVSVERLLLGPLRVMAPCYAMGEAAGQAAVMALDKGGNAAQIDSEKLRDRLRETGAIVDAQAVVGAAH